MMLTQDEQKFIDREIERGRRWGKMTFGQVMDTLDRQYDALATIVAMKNDTLGARDGTEENGTRDFDRGCRMAFYRCADVASKAISNM